jgi:deoxyhypusine synthase
MLSLELRDNSGDRLSNILIPNDKLEDIVVTIQEAIKNNENAQVLEAIFENPRPFKGLEELLEKAFLANETKSSIDLEKSACEDDAHTVC